MSALLQDDVAAQAQRRGDAVALVMGERRMTYGELETASNRLARMLAQVGCGPGDRICLAVDKSPEAIAAMLATLKLGAAYVPLDTASPAVRTARIVRAAQPHAVLAGASAGGLLDELALLGALPDGLPIGALEGGLADGCALPLAFEPHDSALADERPPQRRGEPADGAHILFTSGSTGEPKGVVVTHRNVTAFVDWATAYFGTRPGDRISGHTPFHFDLSTFDIYATLRAGASLHLIPQSTILPAQLAAFITEHELTQWFSVPTTFNYMAKYGVVPDDGFPSLERVLWCGEVLPTPTLIHWMTRNRQATFTNLYGPTETTIASSYHTVEAIPHDETAPIPIGVPCAGEELLVLDEELRPVPAGAIGDIYIAGAGVTDGYWRDEERTRAAFVADPRPGRAQRIYRTGDLGRFDERGLLQFLGRTDAQIKSRGYRIELGEIEAALSALPELMESAVVAVDAAGFEGATICCTYAPVEGTSPSPSSLRSALSATLPSYMLPARWMALAALPKNVNGKIDRRRLRELHAERLAGAVTA